MIFLHNNFYIILLSFLLIIAISGKDVYKGINIMEFLQVIAMIKYNKYAD